MTASETAPSRSIGVGRWLVPLCALLVGGLVRLSFVLRSDFPLNDGGLFYLMTQELQRAGYRLPAYTAYNGAGIPFAYPPLGLYLAGLMAGLGPWSLVDVFRFLPLIFSLLAIPAFYALARALLADELAAALATFAFALLPNSFTWQIMGGGLTRAAGLLFAILAIQQAHALYTRPQKRRYVLTTGLCAALTALSHLAMALLAAVSIGLLFLAYGRSRRALLHSLLAAAVAALISAPWWGVVLARHGLAPFLAASHSSEPPAAGLFYLLMLPWTEEPRFPLLAGLALLGLLACLVRRRFVLPAWLVLLFVADPRTAGATASLPLALLAGLGVSDVILPLVNGETGLVPAREARTARAGWDPAHNRLARLVLCAMLVYAAWSSLDGSSALAGLSPDERAAMAWVAGHTPTSSRFLVLTGNGTWGADRSSEWFPVLAARQSVATVQGREWFEGFSQTAYAYVLAQRCVRSDGDCLADWATGPGEEFTHIYVAKRGPAAADAADDIRSALRADPRYQVLYDGPGATIFRVSP